MSPLDVCPPWPEHLSATLVDVGRRECLPKFIQTPLQYSTNRLLQNRRNAERNVIASIACGIDSAECIPIELLPYEIEQVFAPLSLRFSTRQTICNSKILSVLKSSVGWLWETHAELAATVSSLVWAIHILEAETDDYDVSHSTPSIPFTVFVSVPQTERPDATLRVVEALIHEAMHLQLSLFERVVTLVQPDTENELIYSPWRQEPRPVGGILHALYVFRVIERFWSKVARNSDDSFACSFAMNRIASISDEISTIQGFEDKPGLTLEGRKVVKALFA